MNTKVKYLGLELPSPIVAGSSGLTCKVDDLVGLEQAGAGAVILKSVFEEQIVYDIKRNMTVVAPVDQYGASYQYLSSRVADDTMVQHLALIREARQLLSIPIIGSIHCYQFENWVSHAKRFEDAGCDALEVNLSVFPYETNTSEEDVKRFFQNVINTLKRVISIPISIKITPYFTDMAKFMEQLSWTGIKGVTLFNRSMGFDIDIHSQTVTEAPIFSSPSDVYNTLNWVAILSRKMRCDLSASTGVYTADDVVKMLLAGARSVQVVSCLYRNGIGYMRTLNDGLQAWMKEQGYESIDQFCGKLAVKSNEDASMFLRTQFMKHFNGI